MTQNPISYCICCAREFSPDRPDVLLCPECGGPPEAAPTFAQETGSILGEPPPISFDPGHTILESFTTSSGPELTLHEHPDASAFAEGAIPAEWQVGDNLLDTYTVSGLLGEGGMGKVYRVHHKSWNIDLAVKSPRPEFFKTPEQRDLFISEADTWVNLGLHPHIVTCYYVRTLGGIPRVFAELVAGGSLADWIAHGKITSLEQALDLAIQFDWGLGYAHQKELVHKDVKPANVLMTPEGVAKVTDFGLVKASHSLMTPPYASPEQVNAALNPGMELTLQTDIWSWGLSILEMFAGRPFWVRPEMPDYAWGQVAPQALEHYLSGEMEDAHISYMPPALAELLAQCFQMEPTTRPGSMDAIVDCLDEIYTAETGQPYTRQRPKAIDLRADSLNNKALSLIDLGKKEEAERAWREALQANPNHTHATFNFNRWLWTTGQQPYDTNLVKQMENLVTNNPNDADALSLLAQIHLERGSAAEALSVFDQLTDAATISTQTNKSIEIARTMVNVQGENPRSWKSLKDEISSVDISANGSLGISVGSDFVLKLWETETGKHLDSLSGHTARVNGVAMTPDGRYALSGSADLTLRLWDILHRKCIYVLNGHENSVNSVDISDDGRCAISGSDDATVRMWDLQTGQCVGILKGHGRPVTSVALSADGSRAISGGKDQTAQAWLLDWTNQKGRCIQVLEGHSHDVYSVAITSDGVLGFSGSGYDSTLCAWDLNTRKQLWHRTAHEHEIFALATTRLGEYVLSGSTRELRVWDSHTGTCLRTLTRHVGTVNGIALVPDGSIVFCGDRYGSLTIWKPGLTSRFRSTWSFATPRVTSSLGKIENVFRKNVEEIKNMIRRQEFQLAASRLRESRNLSGFERDPTLLDLWHQIGQHGRRSSMKGAWLMRNYVGHKKMVKTVDISPDQRFAITAGTDQILRYWNLEDGHCLIEMKGHTGYMNDINSAVFSPDGKFALTGSNDLTMRLWDLDKGISTRTFKGHRGGITSVAFTPDGNLAVSVSANKEGTLRLWDLTTGECIRVLESQATVAYAVDLSPQGRYALVATDSADLQYWDLTRGEKLFTLKGNFRCARISPDGRFAFSGSGVWDQYAVRIWDLETQTCLRKMVEHKGEIYSLAVTTDGRVLCSGSQDRTIRIWNVETGECLWVLDQFANIVTSLKFTRDSRYLLCSCWDSTVHLWQLDWEYEFPPSSDWYENARPYLETFLRLHQPYSPDRISRLGTPVWDEASFQKLITDLGYRGYGWLRPEGVRRKLQEMATEKYGV